MLFDRKLQLELEQQQLNIISHMQTKYCQKLSRLNNITYASRNLFTVRVIQ